MSTGLKANSDGSAAIQVGGTDVITLTSGGAATFVTSPTTVQAGTAAAPSITFSGDTNTGIYSPGADTIAFTEGGVESMRIDSAGNVGIGTTSPNTKLHLAAAGDVGGKAVNSATTGSATFNVTNNSGSIGQLMIYGSAQGAYGALGSGEVAMYCTTSTTLMVDNVSGVLKFTAGGNAERMRLSAAGGLSIGTTTDAGAGNIRVNGGALIGDGTAAAPTFTFYNESNVGMFRAAAGALGFTTGGTERLRITSTGACVFGGTTAVSDVPYNFYSSTQGQIITRNNLQAAGRFWRVGVESGNDVFIIYPDSSGGVYMTRGATSWTGNSDERLKTDLKPIENAAEKITQLRTVTGRFKTDEENVSRAFLIAQDVQTVLPEAVDAKDDELGTLGIRYTDTIPLLVAAIKEQQAMIDELKAKVAALEGA